MTWIRDLLRPHPSAKYEGIVIAMIALGMIAAYTGPVAFMATGQLLDCWASPGDQRGDGHVKIPESICVNPHITTMYALATAFIWDIFLGAAVTLCWMHKIKSRIKKDRYGYEAGSAESAGLAIKRGILLLIFLTTVIIQGYSNLVFHMGPFTTMLNIHIPIACLITGLCHMAAEIIHHRSEFADPRYRLGQILMILPTGIALCNVGIMILYNLQNHPGSQEEMDLVQICLALGQAAMLAVAIAYMKRNHKIPDRSQLASIMHCALVLIAASMSAINHTADSAVPDLALLSLVAALFSSLLAKPLAACAGPRGSRKEGRILDEISGRLYHKLKQVPAAGVMQIAMTAITCTVGTYILTVILRLL